MNWGLAVLLVPGTDILAGEILRMHLIAQEGVPRIAKEWFGTWEQGRRRLQTAAQEVLRVEFPGENCRAGSYAECRGACKARGIDARVSACASL